MANIKKNAILSIVIVLTVFGFIKYKNGSNQSNGANLALIANSTDSSQTQTGNIERTNEYKNSKFGFSIKNLPESLSFSEFAQDRGDIILAKSQSGYQMQIYVTPFDEDISLTADRIRSDIPDIDMQNPVTISISSVPGVSFKSSAGDGEHREIWFVYKKHLFQILSYAKDDSTTAQIVSGWQWQR